MHSFRLRYIALGLLIYIQSAFSRTCVSDFDDVPSRTARAAVVFEGRVHREVASPEREGHYQVRFRVVRVLKGDLEQDRVMNNGGKLTVTVGEFGPAASAEDCMGVRLDVGSLYIVFLQRNIHLQGTALVSNTHLQDTASLSNNHLQGAASVSKRLNVNSTTDLDGGMALDSASQQTNHSRQANIGLPGILIVHRMSSFPVPVSEKFLKEVRENACQKCAKSPRAKLTKSSDATKVRLQCKTTGKPKPLVKWFKDDVPITFSKRILHKEVKRGWQLEIRKPLVNDSATYQCQARNVLGQSELVSVSVVVGQEKPKAHSKLCSRQTYCFNGGICYVMTSLSQNYCECVGNYVGERCEELNTGHNTLMTLEKDGTYGKKKRALALRLRRHKLFHPSDARDQDKVMFSE